MLSLCVFMIVNISVFVCIGGGGSSCSLLRAFVIGFLWFKVIESLTSRGMEIKLKGC